ncbi:MAG TPA: isochorismatase family protein [Baekduia sp.]|jgi:nicotinamidase-related amidase
MSAWPTETGAFYAERGIGARIGWGTAPALLIIDMAKAFNDPAYGVGSDQTAAVEATAEVLDAARAAGLPVYFFTTAFEPDGSDGGMFIRKVPALRELVLGSDGVEIDERLAPREGEPVILKKYSSAFFGTPLASTLRAAGVDTIILTGCSTSGCIRAAALDGVSHGFRVIVPREAVADRAPEPHEANLFDIDAKYGDVEPLHAVVAHLQGLPGADTTTKGD